MKEYDNLFDRFYNSVYSCGSNGVGNFVVPLVFNVFEKRFEFRSYNKNETSGTGNLIGANRESGDYAVCVFGSNSNSYAIHEDNFKRPPMLPYCWDMLKSTILGFYEDAKNLISSDFVRAEKIVFFIVNDLFKECFGHGEIKVEKEKVVEFKQLIDFINKTEWKSFQLKIEIVTK